MSNVKQRRILLTVSSVIETYHGESMTLVSVGRQKRHCSSRHWNHSCVTMVPNMDDFFANITSASKIEDFEFVYCCFMRISE